MYNRGMTVVLGEMDVARMNPYRSGQGEPPVHMAWFASPPASGSHPIPGAGGDSRSAFFPVDDIHQARITEGLGGWRKQIERINSGIGCQLCCMARDLNKQLAEALQNVVSTLCDSAVK